MNSFILALTCTLMSLMITILYFGKSRALNEETKVYKFFCIGSLASSVLETVFLPIGFYDTTGWMVDIIGYLYYFSIYFWVITLANYAFVISVPKINKLIVPHTVVSCLVYVFFMLNFPIELHRGTNFGDSCLYGKIDYMTAALFTVYFFAIVVIVATHFDKKIIRKYIPIFSFIAIVGIVGVMQFLFRGILLVTAGQMFITYMMYFTMENPDMRLVAQIEAEKKKVEEVNKSKMQFLSSMSHEIGTPLNVITGLSQSILNKTDAGNEKLHKDTLEIRKSARDLSEIAQNMIDMCRLEDENVEIDEHDYDVFEIIDDVISTNEYRIIGKNVTFLKNISPDIPSKLIGDSKCIQLILNNILSNAFKYTHIGFVELTVSADTKDDVCHLMFKVSDTGKGMDEAELSNMFISFSRGESVKNSSISGTGLGLAITKKIVNALNGTIEVQSEENKGSTFTVNLDQKIAESGNVSFAEGTSLKEFGPRNILIVDDSAINVSVCKTVLSNSDFVLTGAYSGEECLEMINGGEAFDLIFMDIMMPQMNGIETLGHLKKIEGFNTPVVALTADVARNSAQHYKEKGFTDFLGKPYTVKEMRELLTRVFE